MAKIRKRRLPSGRLAWQADYNDASGRRRHRQFATKREADAFMVQARGEVAHGIHTPDGDSIVVRRAADLWLERCERDGLEATTLRQYRTHVELHIAPRIGGTKLSRLTAPAIAAFFDLLLADGRSREMVKRVRSSLSSIVSEAQRRGLVASNNVRDVAPVKRSMRVEARPEMPTRDELRAILANSAKRERPLIMTAVFAGLRGSELRGLMWQDVDLNAGVLHVRRRADRYNRLGPPKSEAGFRDIPLTPKLLLALKAWRLACPIGDLGLVFPTGAGNVESHGNILSRIFWPIQVRAGIVAMVDGVGAAGEPIKVPDAKFSLHALRHAAAALWIEQGLSPKRIQRLMGHASIQQTFDTYGYLFEAREDERAAMAAVEVGLIG